MRKNIRVFWYNEFGVASPGIHPETLEKQKDPMEKLESELADDLLSLWLRATGRTAQNILDDPKYKSIPTAARSTIQRMIDFGELEMSFSVSRNLGENGRLNMIKKVISDGFKGKDSIIIFDSNGGTNYDVKTVTDYNALVFRDITKFNKNVFTSIFRTPENLKKYVGTINTKNWSDLGLYFQSRQWSSRLLEGVNPVLYKTFFTDLAERKKKEERDKIDPLFTEMKEKFRESPQVVRGIELFAKGVGIEFGADGNVDINKVLSKIIGRSETEGKSDTEALKHLTTELSDLRKRIEEISKSIKAERGEILGSLGGGPGISLGRFPELSGINMKVHGADGKEKDLSNTAIISLSKTEANAILTNIGSSIDKKNVSSRIAKVIILLGLQVRYGETAQAKGSIRATEKEFEKRPPIVRKTTEGKLSIIVDESTKKKIALSEGLSAQSQVLQDTKDLTVAMNDEIGSIKSAQLALEKLRAKADENKSQADKEKEARLVAYIEQNAAIVQTYKTLKTEYGESGAKEIFQEYYEIGRDKPLGRGEKIDYQVLEKTGIINDPESSKSEKILTQMTVGQPMSMSD